MFITIFSVHTAQYNVTDVNGWGFLQLYIEFQYFYMTWMGTALGSDLSEDIGYSMNYVRGHEKYEGFLSVLYSDLEPSIDYLISRKNYSTIKN